MDNAKEEQTILGEVRQIRRTQEEISLALRVDTPWIKAQEHLDYALRLLRRIPMLCRVCLFLGFCLFGAGALGRNGRLIFLGVDMFFLSLLFVGASQ